MESELEGALFQLIGLVGTLQDLDESYAEPPEKISVFPSAITYPLQGEISHLTGGAARGIRRQRHTVNVDIHQSRIVHPKAFLAVQVWPGRMYELLRTHRDLNGSIDSIQWPLNYAATEMPYGLETHYGMRFEITLQIL